MAARKIPVTYLLREKTEADLFYLVFLTEDGEHGFFAHGRHTPSKTGPWKKLSLGNTLKKQSGKMAEGYRIVPRSRIPQKSMESLVAKLKADNPNVNFRHDGNGNILAGDDDEPTATPEEEKSDPNRPGRTATPLHNWFQPDIKNQSRPS